MQQTIDNQGEKPHSEVCILIHCHISVHAKSVYDLGISYAKSYAHDDDEGEEKYCRVALHNELF